MNDLEQRIRQRVTATIGMKTDNALALATQRLTSHASLPSAVSPDELSTLPPALEAPPVSTIVRERPQRPGTLAGSWRNPFVAAAMPALLLIERARRDVADAAVDRRGQLSLEIAAFRQKLGDAGTPQADIACASYLLCTYADEIAIECYRRQGAESVAAGPPRSLLVDFHGDAWGGESCFADLDAYLRDVENHRDILGLYALVLDLGLVGRYRMVDQGDVLLNNLRARLHTALSQPVADASLAVLAPAAETRRRPRVTAMRLLIAGLLLCIAGYFAAAWHLREQGLPVRQAILSWDPPAPPPRIDIRETLPTELSALLAEGWLEAVKQPYGWLLLFTSDHAFASARAELNTDYVRNITRLGRVLAAWPGDLEVVGHTDAQPLRSTRFKDNQALSVARARSVQRILLEIANARQPDRAISAIGKGDAEPIADDATDAGRRRNRRVDIRWKVTTPRL
jgi:type VI secretion system protein ImpK